MILDERFVNEFYEVKGKYGRLIALTRLHEQLETFGVTDRVLKRCIHVGNEWKTNVDEYRDEFGRLYQEIISRYDLEKEEE